jgi:hypothetical protein
LAGFLQGAGATWKSGALLRQNLTQGWNPHANANHEGSMDPPQHHT